MQNLNILDLLNVRLTPAVTSQPEPEVCDADEDEAELEDDDCDDAEEDDYDDSEEPDDWYSAQEEEIIQTLAKEEKERKAAIAAVRFARALMQPSTRSLDFLKSYIREQRSAHYGMAEASSAVEAPAKFQLEWDAKFLAFIKTAIWEELVKAGLIPVKEEGGYSPTVHALIFSCLHADIYKLAGEIIGLSPHWLPEA